MLKNTRRAPGGVPAKRAAAVLLLALSAGVTPGAALARKPRRSPSKPAPPTQPAAPAPASTPPEPPPPVPHIQRLVFSPYLYSYQADTRRRIPVQGVRNADDSSALIDHPWQGLGPWFSYDRSQWHKSQLPLLREAGVDVILPVFRGDTASRNGYAIKGLDCLAQALKELRQEGEQPFVRGRDYPLVGMCFDTNAMRAQYGEAPDMRSEEARRTFCGMIREFFLHIPPEFRATVPLPPERARARHPIPGSELAPGTAYVVYLNSPAPLQNLDAAALSFCAARLEKVLGAPILWLGGPEFQGRAEGLDGVLSTDNSGGGWIDLRELSPGRDTSAAAKPSPAATEASTDVAAASHSTPEIVSRRLGRTYIEGWINELRAHPDWMLVNSWNAEREGTGIAPTNEFGDYFISLSRAGTAQFRGGVDYGVHILQAAVPAVIAPRTLYQVPVTAENTGYKSWTSGLGMGLSYRWYQDGQPVGDPAPVASTSYVAASNLHRFTIGLTSPMVAGKPLPDGDYELRLDMLRSLGAWFDTPGDLPYVVPIRIDSSWGGGPTPDSLSGKGGAVERAARNTHAADSPPSGVGDAADPPLHPYWLTSGMPALAKAGESYTAPVRLRNDSGSIWHKGQGIAVGYRWLRVTSDLHGVSTQNEERLAASGRVELPADVLPGAVIQIPVPVRLVDDQGQPLPVWSPKEAWSYVLEWDLFDGQRWASESGAPTRREAVAVLADDLGPSIIGTGLATTQPSGNTTTTKVGLRNDGPEVWHATTDRLVYHWYFFDGSEARWAGLETALPNDVQPGETVVVPGVRIQVPDFTGPMYLTLDLKRGQNYASTGSNSHGSDLYVLPVNLVGGAMQPLDLSSLFDTDGISFDNNRADGDLDGQGHTLPAELLPPYQLRPPAGAAPFQTTVYPCGLWTQPVNQGDRVPFSYPSKQDGSKNFLSCNGQRLEFPPGVRAAVHLMGLALTPDASGDVTLIYQDGSTSVVPLEMSSWTEGPKHGEHAAFTCLHRHNAKGDEPGVRCYLYHYRLRPQRGKTLVAAELPGNAAMKIMAITLETDTTGEAPPGLHLPSILSPK